MIETTHHYLPVVLAVYLPVSCFITYGIAVGMENVHPFWPFISDTGTLPPESCVFAQLLNFGAVLAGVIVYIRYRQIYVKYVNVPGRNGLIQLNTAAYIIGIIMVVGVTLVGNFQETNIVVVHLIGAFLAFVIGFVYCILQTVISYKVADDNIPGNDQCIRRTRVALCVIDIILIIIMIVANAVSKSLGPGKGKSKLHWSDDDPGYAEHVVSTVSEWLVSFVTVIYIATFYPEFKHFRVKPPAMEFYNVEHRDAQAVVGERRRLYTGSERSYSSITTTPTPTETA